MTRMRNFIVLSLIILLSLNNSFSSSIVDSLQQKLTTSQGEKKAEILLELSKYNSNKNLEKSFAQADEALEIAEEYNSDLLRAKAYYLSGYYYSISGNSSKTLECYDKALSIYQSLGLQEKIASVYQKLGRFYKGQGDYSKAIEYFFKSLRIRENISDVSSVAESYYYLASTYFERDELDKAIEFYENAFAKAKESENQLILSMSVSDLGVLYQQKGDFDKSLEYFEKGLSISEEIGSYHARATILSYMSSVYLKTNSYDRALSASRKQIEIGKKNENSFIIGQGLENLALLYRKQDLWNKSLATLKRAKSHYAAIGTTESELEVNLKIAEYYAELNRLDSAILLSKNNLSSSLKMGSFQRGITSLETLIQVYTQREEYDSAYVFQVKLTELQDSLFSNKREEKIAQMQARYETEKQEKEIRILENQQERAELIRNVIIGGVILLLIIGLLIYYQQRTRLKKNQTMLENKQLKEKQLQQSLKFKNKQLTTHSLNLVQKNETMKELKEDINNIKNESSDVEIRKKLRGIDHLIDFSFNLDEDWEKFRHYFEKVHSDFYGTLKEKYPELTTKELRLSALVKLQLSIKEIATLLGITPDSVKTARYRLRKKLDMKTEESLTEFMMEIEKDASKGTTL